MVNNFYGPVILIQNNIPNNEPHKKKRSLFSQLHYFLQPIWWIVKEFVWIIPVAIDILNK